jgi:hypothetical protein
VDVDTTPYNKDPSPYYPYHNNSFDVIPQHQRYVKTQQPKPNPYYLDKQPYYGPTEEYRINSYIPDGVSVPIIMGDVTDTHATDTNLQTLQNKLNELDSSKVQNPVEAGKYMKDPEPYYDPTHDEVERQKDYLSSAIADIKAELSKAQTMPKLEVGFKKGVIKVQNKANANVEDTNEYIANNLWYPPESKTNQTLTTHGYDQTSIYADGNVSKPVEAVAVGEVLPANFIKPVETTAAPAPAPAARGVEKLKDSKGPEIESQKNKSNLKGTLLNNQNNDFKKINVRKNNLPDVPEKEVHQEHSEKQADMPVGNKNTDQGLRTQEALKQNRVNENNKNLNKIQSKSLSDNNAKMIQKDSITILNTKNINVDRVKPLNL